MTAQTHPIRVAAARSGLTPDLLRAWEKRYGAVDPVRADGRRLYTEDDIQRLVLLRRATLAGRRIGDIASLSTDELLALDESDRQALADAPVKERKTLAVPSSPSRASAEEFAGQAMDAIQRFDAVGLQSLLEQAAVALGYVKLLDEVVIPLMHEVGRLWREGDLRIAQEHMCTAVLQNFLTEMRTSQIADASAPCMVVATLPGQYHELGALVVAATAASEGWNVTYLGPNLPTEEIAAAAMGLKARAIALSLIYPADDPRLGDQIERLRRQVVDDVALLIGGSAAGSYAEAIKASRAIHLREMTSLRALLTTMRMRPASKQV